MSKVKQMVAARHFQIGANKKAKKERDESRLTDSLLNSADGGARQLKADTMEDV